MITFESITWKNFLSTGNVENTLSLNSAPTTLIIGQNGAGKCVRGITEIDIRFLNDDVKAKFISFINEK